MKGRWTLAAIVFTTVWASPQTSRPAFDVATVKLNTHCDTGGPSGGMSTPGRIALQCADLRDLILTAYGIYGNGANPASGSFRIQVIGGPAWMDSTRYDIAAKQAGNPPRSEMYGPMMQSLLEERFGLKVHRETKEGPVYLLTVAKNGPKLHATKEGSCVIADINHPPEAGNALTVCGKPKMSSVGPTVTVDIPGASIANLCSQLGMAMDREVIDRTGIAGRFDIHLEVAHTDLQPKFVAGRNMEQPGPLTVDDKDDSPSISTALQQQLGLKLETGRGPVQVLVVDHIERPAGN
jgi:uncharacterized protein (TIGR03435 family)